MKSTTKKLMAIVMLLLIPLLLFTSCGEEKKESEELRTLALDMIGAMSDKGENAYDTAYSLVDETCTKEEFDKFYTDFKGVFESLESVEIYTQDVITDTKDGKTYEQVRYVLLSAGKNLIIQASMEKNTNVLSGFMVGEPDENPAAYIETSGSVFTLGKNNWVQWLLLVVSLLELAFALWAAIDCVLHKFESKWLWLALILLGFFTLSFTFGDGSLGFHFSISLFFKYTALVEHVHALKTLHIMLPAGAVAYVIMRKRLLKPKEPASEKKTYHSYIPDDEKEESAE